MKIKLAKSILTAALPLFLIASCGGDDSSVTDESAEMPAQLPKIFVFDIQVLFGD